MKKKSNEYSDEYVQQQIDELRANWARILSELAEIKRLMTGGRLVLEPYFDPLPTLPKRGANPPVILSTNIVSVDVQGCTF